MDEPIYVIFKVQFDFALEVWFSILSYFKTQKVTDIQKTCLRLINDTVLWVHTASFFAG